MLRALLCCTLQSSLVSGIPNALVMYSATHSSPIRFVLLALRVLVRSGSGLHPVQYHQAVHPCFFPFISLGGSGDSGGSGGLEN